MSKDRFTHVPPAAGPAPAAPRKTAVLPASPAFNAPESLGHGAAASALDRGGWLAHNEAAMEGAVIGQYRVTKKLGEGGMGAVFAAEHALLGRKAAIKMLLPALSQNQEIVQRFFNEARAATAIQDPGIVQIFDFGYHTDGSAYIVMEYLEGEPLDARLKRLGRLNPFDALRILRQASSSLAAAHARGIIHRDLKPENIYLVADREVAGGERPKLLDFGIAKLTGDTESKVKTHTAAIMGTPMYMSPEQCRGAGAVDARSDVYALGCVLFHLITGRTPFDGEGVGEIIASHLREPPPVPSHVVPGLPPELDQLVLRCLAKTPEERFQSASELAEHIGWLLGHGGQPAAAVMPSGQLAAPGMPTPTPTTLSGASGVRWNTGGGVGAMSQPGSMAPAPRGKSKLGIVIAAVGAVGVAAGVVLVLSMGGGKGDGGGGQGVTPAGAAAQPEAPPPPPDPTPGPAAGAGGGDVAAPAGGADVAAGGAAGATTDVATAGTTAVAIDAGVAVATADDRSSSSSKSKRDRDRDKGKRDDRRDDKNVEPTTQPPTPPADKGGCPNPTPGDLDCDGIPDKR